MITSLTLTNYRCFKTLNLRLRPLTVLTGANGVGKSAILEAISSLADPLLDVSEARYIDAPENEVAFVEATVGPMVVQRKLNEFFTGELGRSHVLHAARGDEVSNAILATLDVEVATAVLDQVLALFTASGIRNAFSVHSPAPELQSRTPRLRVRSVSEGIAAALPVLLTLICAEADDLVVIEKPESFLHPAAQSLLGSLIARTVANEVQVIVETHSDHVLNGIRRAVCNNEVLAAESVLIHQIASQGAETSEEITVNAKGNFVPKAPEISAHVNSDLAAIIKARRGSVSHR